MDYIDEIVARQKAEAISRQEGMERQCLQAIRRAVGDEAWGRVLVHRKQDFFRMFALRIYGYREIVVNIESNASGDFRVSSFLVGYEYFSKFAEALIRAKAPWWMFWR